MTVRLSSKLLTHSLTVHSYSILSQISEELGRNTSFSKVGQSPIRPSILSDDGRLAVDFFSIATCEVSDAGLSLSVKGERSGSAFGRTVSTLSPQL